MIVGTGVGVSGTAVIGLAQPSTTVARRVSACIHEFMKGPNERKTNAGIANMPANRYTRVYT